MKKILWLIFLSLLSIPVFAKETYYSKYTPYSEFTDKYVLETDTISVKEENRYKWYKEEVTTGDYKLYNKTDSFSDDCYLKELSNWSEEKIDNPGFVYQTKEMNKYLYSHGARYIHLYNINSNNLFNINKINIKYKNKNIDFTYECIDCSNKLNNIKNGSSIIFDLKKEYPVYYIDLLFSFYNSEDSNYKFTIGFSNDKKSIYVYKDFNLNFNDLYNLNILGTDDSFTGKKTYNVYTIFENESEYIISKDIYRRYAYQEKWCKLNKINRIYTDYTNKSVEGYKRDLKTKKVYYSYKTRDKLELEITDINKKMDLNDFIVFSTDKVIIEDNIDWDKNGTYNLKFKLNDLIVNKKVNLNIEENKLSEEIFNLKETIKKLNEIINDNNELILKYEKNINEVEDKIKLKDEEIKKNNLEMNKLNKIIKDNKQNILKNEDYITKLKIQLAGNKDLLGKMENDHKNNIIELNNSNNKYFELFKKNNLCISNNQTLNKKLNNLEYINNKIVLENNNNVKINKIYKEKISELENSLFNLNNGISFKLKEKDDIINNYKNELDKKEKNKVSNDINHKKNNFLLKIDNIKNIALLFGLFFILLLIYFIFKKKN